MHDGRQLVSHSLSNEGSVTDDFLEPSLGISPAIPAPRGGRDKPMGR